MKSTLESPPSAASELGRPNPRRSIGSAFVNRRLRWGPTWLGWVCILLFAAGTSVLGLRYIHRFLALNRPVKAEILVIEGWMPEYALKSCIPLIQSGAYQHVVTVGGPVPGVVKPAPDDDTHAYVAERTLRRLGLKAGIVEIVPTNHVDRDRTLHYAQSLNRWLLACHLSPTAVNVVTLGPHARRSRMLFQRGLGSGVTVGVIAIPNDEYDDRYWWRYSEGIREVISESAGYAYALVFL